MHIGTMTIAVVFVLSLASCGAQPPVPEIPVAEIVWPEPPAAPRIRYVGSFAGPHDLGITKSFFKRVIEAIIGRTEEYMIRPTGVVERNDTLYVADPGAQATPESARILVHCGWLRIRVRLSHPKPSGSGNRQRVRIRRRTETENRHTRPNRSG